VSIKAVPVGYIHDVGGKVLKIFKHDFPVVGILQLLDISFGGIVG
jgi:hypothetical protein